MLLLSRKISESVVIDEEMEVFVMGVKGNQVKLGFKVPKEIPVHRREVLEKIREEKQKAFLSKISGHDEVVEIDVEVEMTESNV